MAVSGFSDAIVIVNSQFLRCNSYSASLYLNLAYVDEAEVQMSTTSQKKKSTTTFHL
jgi:hypothetical protein